jgi:hypothetical protein
MTRFILALAVITSFAFSAPRYGEEGELEKQVRATVESLLKDLGNQKVDSLAGYFTSNAVLIVARERDGVFTNSVETAKRWSERMRVNPAPDTFEERLSNIEITIDSGQLAYLRADFEIIREGTAVTKGVDVFTLLRDGEDWKVAAIAYTNVPAQ